MTIRNKKSLPRYPRHLQKLATDLAMKVSFMYGYITHYGTLAKDHKSMLALYAANKAFQDALVAWEEENGL